MVTKASEIPIGLERVVTGCLAGSVACLCGMEGADLLREPHLEQRLCPVLVVFSFHCV